MKKSIACICFVLITSISIVAFAKSMGKENSSISATLVINCQQNTDCPPGYYCDELWNGTCHKYDLNDLGYGCNYPPISKEECINIAKSYWQKQNLCPGGRAQIVVSCPDWLEPPTGWTTSFWCKVTASCPLGVVAPLVN